MKSIASLIIISLFIISCGSSEIEKKLSNATELEIQFKALNSDSVKKIVTTNDPNAIRKFIGFIDKKETEQFKCGYDGIMFFRNGEVEIAQVDFKFRENDCRHFMILHNDKLRSSKLSNEAANLLKDLEEGKNSY